jgi:sec-independent protein translocase protein TatB
LFGIGPFELLIIIVAAIVFVGPQRLPYFMKQAGRVFVQAKRYSSDVRESFNEVVRQAEEELRREELEALKKEVKSMLPPKDVVSAALSPTEPERPAFEVEVNPPAADEKLATDINPKK